MAPLQFRRSAKRARQLQHQVATGCAIRLAWPVYPQIIMGRHRQPLACPGRAIPL